MYIRKKIIPIIAVVLAFVGLVNSAFGGDARELAYVIERTGAETALYRITVTFTGEADGSTKVELPNEWGGQTALYNGIKNLRAISKNTTLSDTGQAHVKSAAHRPGQKVTLEYFLVQDFTGPFKNGVRYRPIVDKEYIHWIGSTVWVRPEIAENDEVAVTLDWKGFGSDWKFANSYGLKPGKQKQRLSLEDLGRSITVAGDFRITSVSVANRPVNVAIRGNWQFQDSELAEMIRKVIASQREFWNDHSQQYYLVTLVPMDEGPNAFSYGGTGLLNSFALFATPNADVAGLRGLLAHEYFHNWNPMEIGKMPDPEQQMYWLSEGFTEFYTYELLNRSGITSDDEYISEINQRLREYYLLPTRTEPNERIVKDFWNDPNVGRLPYLRGMFFAMNLNAAIKQATGGRHSLDDVMHELFRRSKQKKEVLSPEVISEVVSKYAGAETAARTLSDIRSQMIDGSLITPAALALGTRARMETVPIAVWELGLNVNELLGKRLITGVRPGTAAYNAGLRDGQKAVGGISIQFGNTEKEIEFKVTDSNGEKAVKYLPVALEKKPVPQFAPVK